MGSIRFIEQRYVTVGKKAEIIEICILAAIVIASLILQQVITMTVPKNAFLGQYNQFIVGPIVNCALIIAGINCRGWRKALPLVFAPSVTALIFGLLPFFSNPIYGVYMIPAIWLGNFAILALFKYLFVVKKINFTLTAVMAVAVKVAIIFLGFNIMSQFTALPAPVYSAMSSAMGIYQLYTAAAGAVLAFGAMKTVYRNKAVQI